MKLKGYRRLERKLRALDEIRFDAVCEKSMAQIYNRGKAEGGTPVSTEATRPGGPHGELRQSLGMIGCGMKAVVGYVKSYGPHVEYGHRKVGGGYVAGQYFLKQNVSTQRPIYKSDLIRHIEIVGR